MFRSNILFLRLYSGQYYENLDIHSGVKNAFPLFVIFRGEYHDSFPIDLMCKDTQLGFEMFRNAQVTKVLVDLYFVDSLNDLDTEYCVFCIFFAG